MVNGYREFMEASVGVLGRNTCPAKREVRIDALICVFESKMFGIELQSLRATE